MSSQPAEYDPYQHVARFETNRGRRIYRIRCDILRPLPGYVYLLIGNGPTMLVDCGTGENGCDREILSGFELIRTTYKENFQLGDIRRIIITHAHIDHAGGGKQLLELSGAEAWCHQYDSSVLTHYDERAAVANRRFDEFLKHAGVEQSRRRGIIEAFGFVRGRGKPFSVSRHLKDGEQIDGLTVYHTPGHSPGHLCLLVDESHFLLGDHVLARTITQLWPQQLTPHTGYIHYRESVKKISTVAAGKIGLPGHEQVIDDLPLRIELVRKNHRRRLDRILEILKTSIEPLSIEQIARKMYLSQEGNWALLALTDVGARIEYLEQIGLVNVINYDALETNRTDVFLYK